MKKRIKVILSSEAEEVYRYLLQEAPTSKTERMILTALNKKIELIKTDYHYGEPLAKDLIPKEYQVKYAVTNLFRIELPVF